MYFSFKKIRSIETSNRLSPINWKSIVCGRLIWNSFQRRTIRCISISGKEKCSTSNTTRSIIVSLRVRLFVIRISLRKRRVTIIYRTKRSARYSKRWTNSNWPFRIRWRVKLIAITSSCVSFPPFASNRANWKKVFDRWFYATV